MIRRIGIVGVPVTDQQQAIDFFTEVLGFALRVDEPMGPDARWVELTPQGAPARPALVPYTWMGGEQEAGTYSRISFEADDVDALYEDLVKRGVVFDGPPFDDPTGGRFVMLRDPFGNSYIVGQLRDR